MSESPESRRELVVETLDVDPVGTCDGCLFDAPYARKMARRYYLLGFFCLPWFWAVSAWLFSPNIKGGGDAVVQKCAFFVSIWLHGDLTILHCTFIMKCI